MSFFAEAVISFFLVAGGVFALVGSYGLVKLNNAMSRLHAPTKATTLGVGGVLVASLVNSWTAEGVEGSYHELLITLFLFLTAPVTAHFIAKTHILRSIRSGELPTPGADRDWSTLEGHADAESKG